MIWVLFIIIGLIVGFILGFSDGWSLGDKLFNGFLDAIMGLVVGILLFSIMNSICFQPVEKVECIKTKEVYALKDNSYISGHGGLIYVTIEEEDKYTYMVTNEDGSFSKESISAEDVRIKEVDNEIPSLKTYAYKSKNKLWSIWDERYYCFVVPTGTVTNVYNVDLE